jgi:hypothetical protein
MQVNLLGKKTAITLFLMLIVIFIMNLFKLPEDVVWKIIIELRDQIPNSALKDEINKKIITTPELLNYKVKRDVDKAIREYEKQEAPPPPIGTYYELPPDGSEAQKLLGGAMGIRLTKP